MSQAPPGIPALAPPFSGAAPARPGASRSSPITRRDVLEAGLQGNSWQFLPLACAALRQVPADDQMRLVLAANLVKLGLKTLAQREFAALPASLRDGSDGRAIAAAAARLKPDAIPSSDAHATCAANLHVLAERDPAIAAVAEIWTTQWRAARAHTRLFRAADGNVVRLDESPLPSGPNSSPRIPDLLADHLGQARAFAAGLPEPSATAGDVASSALVIEGLDPPWVLIEAGRRLRRAADSFWPRITVVQADPIEALDGLSITDLRAVLRESRMSVFIGPDAGERFAAALMGRLSCGVSALIVSLPSVRARVSPAPAAAIERAKSEQAVRTQAAQREMHAVYAPRDRAFWAERFRTALDGRGEPLRVLVHTSRYTSFVRHSSHDLAAALRQLGCEVHLLQEPDHSSHLAALARAEAFASFKPDLTILINYTRPDVLDRLSRSKASPPSPSSSPLASPAFPLRTDPIPRNLPFVCWVQDAMPHLFREEVGRALTDLDFLVGHLHPSFFSQFAYPRRNFLSTPVVASEAKFHPPSLAGPVSAAQRDRFICDVAAVSHQSQTPQRLRAELEAASRNDPVALAVIARIADDCVTLARGEPIAPDLDTHVSTDPSDGRAHARDQTFSDAGATGGARGGEAKGGEGGGEAGGVGGGVHCRIRALVVSALRDARGVEPAAHDVEAVLRTVALPIADRAVRHQTFEWAARACARRGWRLRIFGRGWESHPILAPYAAGEVEHSDDLRACYSLARAHLHASINTLHHQRVLECALSGGLPLVRFREDDLWLMEAHLKAELARTHAGVFRSWPRTRETDYWVADSAAALRWMHLRQRLGLPDGCAIRLSESQRREPWLHSGGVPVSEDEAWLLGDLAEIGFRSEAELETRLERAIGSDSWRESLFSGVVRRARRAGLTVESLAARILVLVAASLSRADPEPE